MPDAQTIPLDAQVACVKRELALRKGVYANKVANTPDAKKQKVYDACAAEYRAMQAVLGTLEALQFHLDTHGPDDDMNGGDAVDLLNSLR